jgi:hypothetical protein
MLASEKYSNFLASSSLMKKSFIMLITSANVMKLLFFDADVQKKWARFACPCCTRKH